MKSICFIIFSFRTCFLLHCYFQVKAVLKVDKQVIYKIESKINILYVRTVWTIHISIDVSKPG